MALMFHGHKKIEAIKLHRKLTGGSLKESKDEVEKYWIIKPIVDEGATLCDILNQAIGRNKVGNDISGM